MEIAANLVIEHFGTVDKVAEFFNISRQAFFQWVDGPIPRERALELMVRLPDKFGAARAAA